MTSKRKNKKPHDVHAGTAKKIGVSRETAKALDFGALYGSEEHYKQTYALHAAYLKKCNETVNTILNSQLAALGIDAKDPSLTRKVDATTDEVWWLGYMIMRVKYTPMLHMWYMPPEKVALLKATAPFNWMFEDVVRSNRTLKEESNPPYCKECGQNFAAHNDDGSCVSNDPESHNTIHGVFDKHTPPTEAKNKHLMLRAYIRFECGSENRESICMGPYEFVQITYHELRNEKGDTIASMDGDGRWFICKDDVDPKEWWSDIVIYTVEEEKKT